MTWRSLTDVGHPWGHQILIRALHIAFVQCTRSLLIFGSQGRLKVTQALPPKSRIFITGVYAGMVADQVGAGFCLEYDVRMMTRFPLDVGSNKNSPSMSCPEST